MTDPLDSRETSDASSRIDAADEHALLQWATTLRVSTDELRQAINAVGDQVEDVRRFLQRGRDSDDSAVPQHTV